MTIHEVKKAGEKYLMLAGMSILVLACSSSEKAGGKATETPESKVYKNEYFSLQYPSNWINEDEITNPDTIPSMSKGLRSTFYNPYIPLHSVMVQKSGLPEIFQTPEEWRDASIEFKQFDPEYVGTVDKYMQDSIKFGPYPAAMAGFVVALESGDTLIHKQLVVMVGKDLYYLNNTFESADNGAQEQLGDSILSTIKFRK